MEDIVGWDCDWNFVLANSNVILVFILVSLISLILRWNTSIYCEEQLLVDCCTSQSRIFCRVHRNVDLFTTNFTLFPDYCLL